MMSALTISQESWQPNKVIHKKALRWTNTLEMHNIQNILNKKESSASTELATEDTVITGTSLPSEIHTIYPHTI